MNSLKASSKKLNTPDKASSMMLALHSVPLIDTAEDYPAMLIANHMLGGGALRSRLADRIRQKEGLSYGVGSQYTSSPYEAQGVWFAYAISAPENNAKVEAALRDEMLKAEKEGFTEDELAEAKKGWLQAAENSRTQDAGLAMGLTKYLSLNRTLGYDKKLEAQVKTLSLAQVNAALRKYIQAANLSIISAGDFEKAAKAAPAASK
jgi:zinc protease